MRRTFAFCSSSPHFAKVASNGLALKRAARPLITLSPAATGCMRPPLTCTASSSSSSSSSFLLAHLKSSAIRPSSSSGRRQLFTATSNRTAAKTTSTTPLLASGGHRFGAATKTAIRSIRIEGRPPRSYNGLMGDVGVVAPRDNTAWLLIGGLAALGLGGIALAGYVNQETTTIPTHGDLTTHRLRATYGYMLGGLATTAASAAVLFRAGAAHRVVAMNPWLFMGASLLGTIGSLMVMQSLPPENTVARHLAWGVFNACNGLALSPVAMLGGAVVTKALVATGAVVGSLSLVAAAAPSESFLWMGGSLGVGLGVVIAASMGQMFFPASAFLTGITLYGGLGLFGMMMLYDTQRVMHKAKTDEVYDPMTQSIAIYLNTINIFAAFLFFLSNRQHLR